MKGYKVEKMDVKTGKWTRVGKTTEPEMTVTGLIQGKEYLFRVCACEYISEIDDCFA